MFIIILTSQTAVRNSTKRMSRRKLGASKNRIYSFSNRKRLHKTIQSKRFRRDQTEPTSPKYHLSITHRPLRRRSTNVRPEILLITLNWRFQFRSACAHVRWVINREFDFVTRCMRYVIYCFGAYLSVVYNMYISQWWNKAHRLFTTYQFPLPLFSVNNVLRLM